VLEKKGVKADRGEAVTQNKEIGSDSTTRGDNPETERLRSLEEEGRSDQA